MSDDRLPTALYVEAHLRQLTLKAVPYYIVNKGAPASGTVMIKLCAPRTGCRLLQQQRDIDGVMGWMDLFKGAVVAEAEADAKIKRAVERDPDIWVIEIEDKDLFNPFEGKLLNI